MTRSGERGIARWEAAVRLAPNELPFCFPLVAFLQSVSPFLESPTIPRSLVDVFSAVLDGEVGDLSGRSLFNVTELRLISEFHSDVLSVPTDQLIPALDYVKSNLLKGRPYRREDHTGVALELKKFLTSSADKEKQELFTQLEKQKRLVATAQDKRSEAEEDANHLRSKVKQLEQTVKTAEVREAGSARNQKFLRAALAIVGVGFASVCWWFDREIAQGIVNALRDTSAGSVPLALIIRTIGAVAFVGSLIPTLSRLPKTTYRPLGYTIIVAIAIGASDFVGLPSIKTTAAYLAVAAPIGSIILLALNGRSNRDQ